MSLQTVDSKGITRDKHTSYTRLLITTNYNLSVINQVILVLFTQVNFQ
jgi:hypothetical protein